MASLAVGIEHGQIESGLVPALYSSCLCSRFNVSKEPESNVEFLAGRQIN